MKFSINKNIILEQLQYVSKAISPKNIINILNGIKFELDSKGLSLTASDSNLTIKASIDKEKIESIDKVGSIIVSNKSLLDIIKAMPEDIIKFEVEDGLRIKITSGECEFNLNCLNSLDYPDIDMSDNKTHIDIKAETLKKMIKQTIFAVSVQESRPLLMGINIKVNENILECTATDSYRLAKKTITLDSAYDEVVDIVIPASNIGELEKIISDESKNVEMHIFDKKILFKYENILFQSNLLEGTYPNTSSFIPVDFEHIVNVNLNNYYASINRVALIGQSKDKNIIKMDVNEKEIVLSSLATQIGAGTDKVSITKNNNEEISISFSAKYMIDVLRSFEDEEIIIYMNTDSKPIVIMSASDDSLVQLILPIKTF